MTIAEMLGQNVLLTILGMAIVFAFLWLMVICVEMIAKLLHILGLDREKKPPEKKAAKPVEESLSPGRLTDDTVAAITAALAAYRAEARDRGAARYGEARDE